MARHTPGPWAWFANARSKQVYLATSDRGRQFVMQFERAGMQRTQPAFQVALPSGGGIMVPLFADGQRVIATDPDHNGEIRVTHPDAVLMAASPDLLDAVDNARQQFAALAEWLDVREHHTMAAACRASEDMMRAASTKATAAPGAQP